MPVSFTTIIIFIAVVGVLGLGVAQLRFVKTIYLIATVSPYEQTGSGDGRILVLGDSTGYGTGASQSEDSVAGRLGADFPAYSIKNNSVNGRTIGQLLPVAKEVSGQYDLILLQIGGNDILQKRDQSLVRDELQVIITELTKHTEQIVMISSGNVGGAAAFTGAEAALYESLSREFVTLFTSVAAAAPTLTYIDLFQEPADDPFVQEPKKYMSWDGLHPSSEGYRYWYRELQPVCREILREAATL